MEEAIVAADRSIATGTLSPLEELVEPELMPQLEEAFEDVLATKDFDTSNVDAGRWKMRKPQGNILSQKQRNPKQVGCLGD